MSPRWKIYFPLLEVLDRIENASIKKTKQKPFPGYD